MKKFMSKIIFLILSLMLSVNVMGAKAKVLKISTTLPESHPSAQALEYFAKKVNEESKGTLNVKVFGNSQLGGNRDGLEGLLLGSLEMVMVTAGPLSQFVPSAELVSLPYVFESNEHMHSVLDGKPGEMLAEKMTAKGFVPLFWLDGGSRSIMNNKKPIQTPEDLEGIKIRVQPSKITIDMANAMGAIGVAMEQGEVYGALEQGVLDGWENSSITLHSLKLYEVTKYFSETNHLMAPDILLISKKSFDKLNDQEKNIIKKVAKEAQSYQRNLWIEEEQKIVADLKEKGVIFNKIDNLKPFMERTSYLSNDFSKKNGPELIAEINKLKSQNLNQ